MNKKISLEQFQQKRIDAFDEIEDKLDDLKKLLRQAKIATVKYYRQDEPKKLFCSLRNRFN